MKKRTVALLMAVVMLFGAAVGGTIAYLTAKSEKVENTFTVGDINIVLDETDVDDTDNDQDVTERDIKNEYKLIPGQTYTKDPMVTVKKDSEPCYVFVKMIEENNAAKTIEFEIDTEKWILVDEANKIYRYYKVVDVSKEANENGDYMTESVIKSSTIKISEDLTKTDMHPETGAYAAPKLTFKACAVQEANLTPELALAEVVFAE